MGTVADASFRRRLATAARGFERVRWSDRRVTWLAFACVLVFGSVYLMWKTRGNTFFWDEWSWIDVRRSGVHSILDSYNSHLEVIPLTVYQLLFRIGGLVHYWPFRLLATLAHLACVTAVFVFVRRRVGGLALLLSIPIVFLGSGWEFVLWGVNFGYTASIALSIGALLALDRSDRRGDAMTCALLVLALAFSEFCLLFAVGIAAELLWSQRSLRRAWIWAVPLLLYALWWTTYYQSSGVDQNVGTVLKFVAELAASAAGGVFGLSIGDRISPGAGFLLGGTVLLGGIGIVGWRLRRPGAFSPRLVALLVTLGAYWLLVALGRAAAGQAWVSRYVYVGVILILLILAESFRGVSLERRLLPAASALFLIALIVNVVALNGGENWLRGSRTVTAELGAL